MTAANRKSDLFEIADRNDEFDDGILKYRVARAEKFSFKEERQRHKKITDVLNKTLSAYANDEIFDLETALTCRALSNYLNLKLHEEASLVAIFKSFDHELKLTEVQLLRSELPNLLSLSYPAVEDIREVSIKIFRQTADYFYRKQDWENFMEWDYLCPLLQTIKNFKE